LLTLVRVWGVALARHINQVKKYRQAGFGKSQFKTRVDFKLWVSNHLKKCDDLTKLKEHIKTFEDYIVDIEFSKMGMK
jgi:hypothetical protein